MSIKETIVRNVSMSLLKARKYAPEILTAGAIISGAASLGLAVKQTMTVEPCFSPMIDFKNKVEEYDKTFAEAMEIYEKHKDDPDCPQPPEIIYTDEMRHKDILIVYAQTGVKLLKHYALPLAFAGVSTACILGLYNVWKARYTAVVAAYTGLQSMFEKYKEAIKEKYGEEVEKETTALTVDKMTEKLTVKDGVATKKIYRQGSQYARFFDESSVFFKRTAGENLTFLGRQQSLANQMLKMNGSLFLNEVYDMLGFPRTKAGSVVGWVHEPGREREVDFGFWDLDDERKRAFINGWENAVLLDFNVDGVIYDLI